MGTVSDYLAAQIARHQKNGLVVWFDPDLAYTTFVDAHPEIIRYQGSFFAIRYQLYPLLEADEPPHVVIYLPLAQEATRHALIELTSIATTLKPGAASYPLNTRLSVIARAALRPLRSDAQLEAIIKDVEMGRMTLADLDQLDGADGKSSSELLRLIFATNDPERITLSFLTSDQHDPSISEKHAEAELRELFSTTYGIALSPTSTQFQMRQQLGRFVLATDLVTSLAEVPAALQSIPRASDERTCQACIQLVHTWRQTRELSESYIATADHVESEFALASVSFSLAHLRQCETFAATETALQAALEDALSGQLTDDLIQLAHQRLEHGFWASQEAFKERWRIMTLAGDLLLQASIIETALIQEQRTAAEYVRAYTEGDHPWCHLDTLQRKLEMHAQPLSLGLMADSQARLIAAARRAYMATGSKLAEAFMRAYQAGDFQVPGISLQREVYSRSVAQAVRDGKTAYLLVDALRFEMAYELMQAKRDQYDLHLSDALGTVPTITLVGMAALLPEAEQDFRIGAGPKGGIAPQIKGTTLKDRRSRLEWLKHHTTVAPEHIAETSLDAFVPQRDKAQLQQAQLIILTSQEIDLSGESNNDLVARMIMNRQIEVLSQTIHALAQLGCETIIITADHGYLYGDSLTDAMQVPIPSGETVELHRRVWIGQGGSQHDAYLCAPLRKFGIDSDLEIAAPWGFGAFPKQGGASAYFHGGLSPQEMIVPVLIIHATPAPSIESGAFSWELRIRSPKISTRMFSVTIHGQGGLFVGAVPRVRIEIREGARLMSQTLDDIDAGIDAIGEIQPQLEAGTSLIKPIHVTLFIPEAPQQAALTLHLVDAATGRDLIIPLIKLTWAVAL